MILSRIIPHPRSFLMSLNVTQLAGALQTVFTHDAEDAARDSGFIKRRRQLTGPAFVQALTFGWLEDPKAAVEELAQLAGELGAALTPSALDQRFTAPAADCLARVLGRALEHVLAARPAALPLLRRFNGVYLQDSSTLSLPAALAARLPGCGGSTPTAGKAALKLQVRWELTTCALEGLDWSPGRSADTKAELSRAFLPPGALRIADLGYYDLEALQDYASEEVYFLSRLPSRTVLFDGQGQKWRLAAFLAAQPGAVVDVALAVGAAKRLPCRLVAVRVPEDVVRKRQERLRKQAQKKGRTVSAERLALCAWSVFITNVPPEKLTAAEVLVLAGARWQVELLFKLWKSEGGLDDSRGHKPYRVLCEVFAKLLAMVVQHWLLLTAGPLLGRSATKAAKRVRKQAVRLARALGVTRQLVRALTALQRTLQRGCRVKQRRGKPATFQILENPQLHTFAPPKT
jgi:DDE family transposase